MKKEILEQHQRDTERLIEQRDEQREEQEQLLKVSSVIMLGFQLSNNIRGTQNTLMNRWKNNSNFSQFTNFARYDLI